MMAKLTEEMVIARTRQSNLAAVVKLNCWGSELSDISLLRNLVNVEVLSLSVNRINTLADIQNCLKLQELFVRKNNIRDLNEICYLKHLSRLKNLNLAENPCVYEEDYRSTVLRCLPNLEKLDEKQVTSEELREAMRLGRDLIHPEEQLNEDMPCPAEKYEYNDEVYAESSDDDYSIGQNNSSTVSRRRSPVDDYYSKENTSSYASEPHQCARMQQGGVEYDETNGLVGEDDHTNSTNHQPVSPSSSTSCKVTLVSVDNNYAHHRHSVQEESEESPRLHPLTRSRTVDSVGDVNSRGEIFSLCEKSRHPKHWTNKQSSREHLMQRGRQTFNSQYQRPVTRNSNILNAVLCLVKELDYQGLEVAEMAIRCRMDELE